MKEKSVTLLAFGFLLLVMTAACATVVPPESISFCKTVCDGRKGLWGYVSDTDLYCVCNDGGKAKVYR
jgi:hypothetical protein